VQEMSKTRREWRCANPLIFQDRVRLQDRINSELPTLTYDSICSQSLNHESRTAGYKSVGTRRPRFLAQNLASILRGAGTANPAEHACKVLLRFESARQITGNCPEVFLT